MSLSQPLGLHKHLTQPSRGLDIVPLFDVLLIALMLTLLGSRFIFAPGFSVDLPKGATISQSAAEPGAAIAVLTLLKDNSLIYGGRLLSVENFEREAQSNQLAAGRAAADITEATVASVQASAGDSAASQAPAAAVRVLLIKSDVSVNTGTLLRVMNAARAAGYERVQIAEQTSRAGETTGTLRR